jgi:phosphoribosylglycinamide formyltransferase-1
MLADAAGAGVTVSVLGNLDDAGSAAGAAVQFCQALRRVLDESSAQQLLILSDVDTSLLTREFLEAWVGNVVLVHDSLLPAFPDANPVEAAIRMGVCITGCTVCFALPAAGGSTGVCHGPIIMQESTSVLPWDTVDSLRERVVSDCECKVLPQAMQLVAEGAVVLHKNGKFTMERQPSLAKDLNLSTEAKQALSVVTSLGA